MNILLFSKDEIVDDKVLVVSDHRAVHLNRVLKVEPGQKVRAGEIDGDLGIAEVLHLEENSVTLCWQSNQPPPPKLPCKLIMALPRPKMMSRAIQTACSMGVEEIHLINTWKVEKSYWKSPRLSADSIKADLLLGLSQSGDTKMPKVIMHQLFRPFAEDRLPQLCEQRTALVAHPYLAEKCPVDVCNPSTLAIGPEGGFTEFELNLLKQAGMKAVDIGPRILRVETVVPALLGRLYPA